MTVTFPYRLGHSHRRTTKRDAGRSLLELVTRPVVTRTAAWSLALAALMLQPYPLFFLIGARADSGTAEPGEWSILIAHVAMLAAGVLLFCDWRISRRTDAGVLGATLAFITVQELPFALASLLPSAIDDGHRLTVLHMVIVAGAATAIAWTVNQPPARLRRPFATGAGLGLLILLVRITTTRLGWDPELDLSGPTYVAFAVCVSLLVAKATVVAFRSRTGSGWAWRTIAVALALWYVARLAATAVPGSTPPPATVLLVVLAATVLFAVAYVRFGRTLSDARANLAGLSRRASHAEEDLKKSRELVHEMNDAIAAIAAGSGLLVHERGPVGPHRTMLLAMVNAEVSRLTRMVAQSRNRHPVDERPAEVVAVDDVVTMLGTAQRALGRPVSWECGGHQVIGNRDAIAEVLTILLSNAARHAPGTETVVSSRRVGDRVEIRVSDGGPGVPEHLMPTLFSWGSRGEGSPGEGIGLHLARRLMVEQGGFLELEVGSQLPGATFVATLPAAPDLTTTLHGDFTTEELSAARAWS